MSSAERTMAAIVDGFVPGDDGLPSGSELGVHRMLLAEVEALGRPSFSSELALLLRLVESRAANLLLTGRPVRFSELERDEREAYLRRLSTSRVPLERTAFQDLKRLTMLLAYGLASSPYRALTGFAEPVPAPPVASALTVRTPSPGEVVEADAIVVGSGAGGGLVAARLAASGRRVVVLERAAHVPEARLGATELEGLATLFLDRGLTATSDRWIAVRAGSAVGGGTVVNWSSSFRAPDDVREEWRAAGIGDELDAHYEIVEREIHVVTGESERNGPNAALERGLLALGLPAMTIPRNVRDCGECGPCTTGCRIGAKQSGPRTYLARACADGAEILDRTEALRIVARAGRVEAVLAAVPGGEVTVRAPLVALAGGAILSPALLLRSAIAPRTAGRTLRIHPVAAIVGTYDEAVDPWAGVPQSVMSDAFANIDGAHGFRIEAAPTHPGLIATGYPWSSARQHLEAMRHARHDAAFVAIVRDRTTGSVDIAPDRGVRIRYAPGPSERALLRRGMVELARIHRAAGARKIASLHTPSVEWSAGSSFDGFVGELRRRPVAPNRVLLFTAHQLSSCPIGPDRATSVADPDGRAWDVEGLYVTDGSALPSATGVNPMLSIMAVASRTAERMVAR